MVVYKLHYFNLTGLGEAIRFLFKYGGIDFEDIRYEITEWEDNKNKFPLKKVPMLEMDDKKILQSISICRFLANKVGLAGSNELENLEIDAVVDTISDIRTQITLAMWEQDAEIKEKKLKLLRDELLPLYFGKLEEYAAANDGHLSCKKLTWADLFLASFTVYFAHGLKDDFQDFKGYPNLQKVVENVMAIENIKKYVDERPATFC